MKAKRKGEVLRVSVEAEESALLAMLLDDLETLLDSTDDSLGVFVDPALARLYPDGYSDDSEASEEFRGLVGADLRTERSGRLQLCRSELPLGGGRIELDDDGADRWIRVLNDVRLVLGVRLEVSEDTELDPSVESNALYGWLTAVQDMLVLHLMG
ncbi:DUF2017 domain-containing protein [Jatrophihabitans telluris]|uniref:DUF2017 domain-containing protein n=1 Tax=Jatrophihabitans telluris TaxID=2038343 RepID=A0ABY4R2N3_9ACTN|nr:DUF2017 family protein [Jatrophihabitans telluris]UQX89592.1 DUF2017 domain-containing protein [Jatrophihabitans telluris]